TANAANANATDALNKANSANSKIDGLEIGGRNIVKDTGTPKSIASTGATNITGARYNLTVSYLTDIKDKELIVVFDWKYEGENPSGTFYMQTGEPQYGTVTSRESISPTNTSGTIKKIWKPTMEKDTKIVYMRTDNMVGTLIISNLRIYFGTMDIGWTPAPEDIQEQIDANKTEISTTKSNMATIETNLSSITSRVSTVENKQTTVDGKVTSLQTRMQSAEQKLTKEGLTTIISNHYTTSNDVNGIVTSKGYQTHSQVQQIVDKLQIKFTESGGYNKLYNSAFANGLANWTIRGTPTEKTIIEDENVEGGKYLKLNTDSTGQGFRQIVKVQSGKKYTFSAKVTRETGTIVGLEIYHNGKWYNKKTDDTEAYKNSIISITVTAEITGDMEVRIGRGGFGTNGISRWYWTMFTEGELVVPWSPHPSEVYDGITTIDKDGITVTSSNVKSKTTIRANGFKLTKTDTNEDVFKVNNDGRLSLAGEITTYNNSKPSGYFGKAEIRFRNWQTTTNEEIAWMYGAIKTDDSSMRGLSLRGLNFVGLGISGSGTKGSNYLEIDS
ncbi:TPA: hypothetical protein P1J72_003847, partial [Clostridioides difficile]|nr:hypothetical protein [Clostridioides difficile]